MIVRIIAADKDRHYAFAERVYNVRPITVDRFEYVDNKNGAWTTAPDRLVYNPKIIKEVSRGWLYKIDLTEVGDNASE